MREEGRGGMNNITIEYRDRRKAKGERRKAKGERKGIRSKVHTTYQYVIFLSLFSTTYINININITINFFVVYGSLWILVGFAYF